MSVNIYFYEFPVDFVLYIFIRVPNYLQKWKEKKNVKKFVLHSKHKKIIKLKVKEGEATARVRSVVICDIVGIIVFMCEACILL